MGHNPEPTEFNLLTGDAAPTTAVESPTQSPAAAPAPRPPRTRRQKLGFALLLLCTLAVTFVFGAWITLQLTIRGGEIVTPAVVDLDLVSAQARLAGDGLTGEVIGRRVDAKHAEGRVVEQFPTAGSRTKPGRPVKLILSLGRARAAVPDLTGGGVQRAQFTLRGSDLTLGSQMAVPHRSVAAGKIVAQEPPAGVAGSPGDTVSVLVSAGPPARAYVMPDLTGRPAGAAARELRAAGFQHVAIGTDEADDTDPSAVQTQAPPPGYRVLLTDRIALKTTRPTP